MQTGIPTVESSVEIPQKFLNVCAFWPSNSTSWNIPERTQNTNLKEHKQSYVHHSIIYNCQDMEAAPASISRCVDKTTMGQLHNGILLICKKEESFTLCNSMVIGGEGGVRALNSNGKSTIKINEKIISSDS